jgi:gliding motility-associated-like protein
MVTLAPSSCSGNGGYWAWYQGPIISSASAQAHGPGFFYEGPGGGTNPNNPGDNYGDHCPSQESLEFCWIIRTVDTEDCLTGLDLDISVNVLSDDQSGGSFLSTICGWSEAAVSTAELECCDADAGADQVLSLCSDGAPMLLDALVNFNGTGSWHYGNSLNPSLGNTFTFNPAIHASGVYIYVIEGTLFDCQDQAQVLINVQSGYSAGTGGDFNLCASGGIINLYDLIQNENLGGTWYDPFNVVTDPYFSPSNDAAGSYTYSFPANGSCAASTSQVTLNLYSSLNPGTGAPITFCPCQNSTSLISLLTGNPLTWGYWTDPNGTVLSSPNFIPGSSPAGTYTYHLDGLNCQAQSTVQINNGTLPNPGSNNAVTLCPSSTAISSLMTFLNGSPASGGVWINPTGNVISNGMIDPATANPGPYTYKFTCGPCTSQAVVQVNISPSPTLSLSGSITQCNTNPVNLTLNATGTGPFNVTISDELGALINLSSQNNGAVIPVNSTQSHSYTITSANASALPYCGVTIGDSANVFIGPPPSAALTGNHILCPGQSLELTPTLLGNGPFQLQVFSSVTGLTSIVGPIAVGDHFTVFPTSAGSFSITQVSDASMPTCTASGSGQVNITFTQAPSASLVGGGTLCSGQPGTAVVDINGQWTSYDLTIETGFGPVYLENVSDGQTISFPVPFSTPPNLPYCLADLSPSSGSGCQATLNDTCMSFVVLPPLITYSLSVTCNDLTQEATVSFYVQGGAGNFTVNGQALTGNFFQSSTMPNGSPFNFSVSDGLSCGPVIRSGIVDCDCSGSTSGTLQYPADTVNVCFGETLVPQYSAAGSFLDANDVLSIVLHDGDVTILGNVLDAIPQNGSGFSLQSPLISGQVYFMSAVVGNNDGSGLVNMSDVCLSYSEGIPLQFIEQVSSTISGLSAICEGEQATISVQLDGNGPWAFEILLDGQLFQAVQNSTNTYTFTTGDPGMYTIASLTGDGCSGISQGSVNITEQALPTASIGQGGTFCQGSSLGPVVNLTGMGPWSVDYTVNSDPFNTILGSSMDVLPVTVSGTYDLVSVSDMNCENSASGSAVITALMAPTVSLVSSGPVCEGEELVLDLDFDGAGPWNLGLSYDGIAQDTVSYLGDTQVSFNSSTSVSVVYLYDIQCDALLYPQVELTVNPTPDVSWSLDNTSICEGEQVLLSITPAYASDFNFQLDLGTGFLTQSITAQGMTFTLNPLSNTTLSLNSLTDELTGCQNSVSMSLSLQVQSLPNLDLGSDKQLCSDDTLVLFSADQGYTYSWSPLENILSNIGPLATYSWANVSNTNQYEWVVLEADNQGCIAKDSIQVSVATRPQIEFQVNPSSITTANPVGNFFNQSPGQNSYSWSVDGQFIQNGPWITYFFPEDIDEIYEVCLHLQTQLGGCQAELCKDIPVIGELTLFIPNSFSPDGDGLNDEFYPVILDEDLSYYVLRIFDRRGELVFETEDPNAHWNGTNRRAGMNAKSDIYTYLLIARDRFGLKAREYRGFITLLR